MLLSEINGKGIKIPHQNRITQFASENDSNITPAQILSSTSIYVSDLMQDAWTVEFDPLSLWVQIPSMSFSAGETVPQDTQEFTINIPEDFRNLELQDDTQIQIRYTGLWIMGVLHLWDQEIDISWEL